MRQEVELLAQVAERTPEDTITRPGEGIGVYSPGYKHLTDIELLVRARVMAAATAVLQPPQFTSACTTHSPGVLPGSRPHVGPWLSGCEGTRCCGVQYVLQCVVVLCAVCRWVVHVVMCWWVTCAVPPAS